MPMSEDSVERLAALTRRSLLAASVAPLALTFIPAAYAQSDKAGAVEDIKGEAFAEKASVRRALDRAAPVFIRDQVGTGGGSRLTMKLGRDTTLKLGEWGRVMIDRYLVDAGGDITLGSGAMLFDRPAGAKPVPVTVRSPFGLIAVRGTRFFAGPSNNVFGVFVQHGRVTVRAAGKSVTLRAGEGTNIAHPGDAPTPPAKWGEPRIISAMMSVN
jgi:ferric-dicitrate binding protein FerR (iron transport regulator)